MDAASGVDRTFVVLQPREGDIAIAVLTHETPAPRAFAAAALRQRMQNAGVTSGKVVGNAIAVTGASGLAVSLVFAARGLFSLVDQASFQGSPAVDHLDNSHKAIVNIGLSLAGIAIGITATTFGIVVAQPRRAPTDLVSPERVQVPITQWMWPESGTSLRGGAADSSIPANAVAPADVEMAVNPAGGENPRQVADRFSN